MQNESTPETKKVLSVIIPCYNEARWVEKLVTAVEEATLPNIEKQIIIVNDGSTDGTREILKTFEKKHIVLHKANGGKGSAVREGFSHATGDFCIIQDADLELDPREFSRLLIPILAGHADVVYGSRYVGSNPRRILHWGHRFGNRTHTLFSNLCTGLDLTDAAICYRIFTREVLESFKHKLTANDFGIDPELTAHVARGTWRVYEVGVSYYARRRSDGKKITWRDGVAALWYTVKFNFFVRR